MDNDEVIVCTETTLNRVHVWTPLTPTHPAMRRTRAMVSGRRATSQPHGVNRGTLAATPRSGQPPSLSSRHHSSALVTCSASSRCVLDRSRKKRKNSGGPTMMWNQFGIQPSSFIQPFRLPHRIRWFSIFTKGEQSPNLDNIIQRLLEVFLKSIQDAKSYRGNDTVHLTLPMTCYYVNEIILSFGFMIC